MAEASTEKTSALPLEDAIADFKYKKALDKVGDCLVSARSGIAIPARR